MDRGTAADEIARLCESSTISAPQSGAGNERSIWQYQELTPLPPLFMNKYTLKWPADFENYSWQIESKGWFVGLEIIVGEKVLRPTFYDPVRLSQDVAEEITSDGFFTEPCLIVINKVTQESIERAIADLARTGGLERLA